MNFNSVISYKTELFINNPTELKLLSENKDISRTFIQFLALSLRRTIHTINQDHLCR
jgi:hypothetical protein